MTRDTFSRTEGLTLLEMLVAVVILGIIASIAYPSYLDYEEKVKIEVSITEIALISGKLESYYTVHNAYPDSLAVLNLPPDVLIDEWGNPYEYLNIATAKGNGKLRKDHSLVPINTDFDLYSKGKDGASASPLTSNLSRDDMVRAQNGAFIGLAADY